MRRALAAVACLAALAAGTPSLAASTARSDYSDLWWNAAESGWGAHVTLQDDVVFLVLFVYDAARQPRFYTASDMRPVAGGGETFQGLLYATRGPAFAGAFDPAQVVIRAVGEVTLRFDSPTAATLAYSVDGVAVSKSITRQGWRAPDLAGSYRGGLFAQAANCLLPTVEYPGTLVVSQAGDVVTIESAFQPGFAEAGTCRMVGRLAQHGSLAAITAGTYTCEFENGPNPVAGTFEITAIEAGRSGFHGRYRGLEGAQCVHAGSFGGFLDGSREVPPAPEPPPE